VPAPPDPQLARAYDSAAYEVDFPSGTVAFRVGEGPPREPPSVILTAFNPGHERPPLPENEAANRELQELLDRRGIAWLPARGLNADRTHVEPSFAVLNLRRSEALAIARQFRQAAIFAWDGHRGSIVWC
jgi:hypothetical protein